MKKAVIAAGGKQYLVAEGETIDVDLFKSDKKTVTFKPLLVIDDAKVSVGAPEVSGIVVSATIEDENVRGNKVTAIRYKPKKRVHTIRGHKQGYTRIKISKIS